MRVCYRFTALFALLALASFADQSNSFVVQAATAAAATTTAASTPESGVATDAAQLDQMLAPLALYPDALLAQVLMATTYPGDVADAASWSKANPDSNGDAAVLKVADKPWDPSVQSLVAFPATLATLGQDPAWVQRLGDAFLAEPDAVMESVQRLRKQAKDAGNLESNEQQKVTVQAAPTQTIIIEPAQPQVIYVPSYNPTVVYGTWIYPAYPPYYYPPPRGYYVGGALVAGMAFGVGVAITNSLWGNCNWGHGRIDINVNRYNKINVNRQLNVNQNTWKHNSVNRDGVPYRDRGNREQHSQRLDKSEQRDAFRGRDGANSDARDRARQSLQSHGIEAPATTNSQARERAQTASRELGKSGVGNQQARDQIRQKASSTKGARDNAFAGSRNPSQAREQISRGQASHAAASRPQIKRGSGQAVQRPARPQIRGGIRR